MAKYCKKCSAGQPCKFRHGTTTGYRYHRCGCDPCTDANTLATQRYRDANRGRLNSWQRQNYSGKTRESALARQREYRQQRRPYLDARHAHHLAKMQEITQQGRRARKRWTVDGDQMVLREDISLKEMALLLGRSYVAVKRRRTELRYGRSSVSGARPHGGPWGRPLWGPDEDAVALSGAPTKVIAAQLGRTPRAVQHRRAQLRREAAGAQWRTWPRWTPKEDALALSGLPLGVVANKTGRTVQAVRKRRYVLSKKKEGAA